MGTEAASDDVMQYRDGSAPPVAPQIDSEVLHLLADAAANLGLGDDKVGLEDAAKACSDLGIGVDRTDGPI